MIGIPSYTDSQTGYAYKLIIEEVIKSARKDIGEEIDDQTLNILKQDWERRLTAVITKSRGVGTVVPQKSDKTPCSSACSVYTINSLNQASKPRPIFYSIMPNNSESQRTSQQVISEQSSVSKQTPTVKESNIVDSELIIPLPDKRKAEDLIVVSSMEPEKDNLDASSSAPPTNSDKSAKKPRVGRIVQLDGDGDDLTDTEDEDVYTDDDETANTEDIKKEKRFRLENDVVEIDNDGNIVFFNQFQKDTPKQEPIIDDDPLTLDDDISEEDTNANDTENLLVCRFEKLIRRKSQWKLDLRFGIASINGADMIFNKASADITF